MVAPMHTPEHPLLRTWHRAAASLNSAVRPLRAGPLYIYLCAPSSKRSAHGLRGSLTVNIPAAMAIVLRVAAEEGPLQVFPEAIDLSEPHGV